MTLNNSKFSVLIDDLSHDGRGVAKIGGKTTFVRGALPGETAEISLIAIHARYNEAKVIHIISPSAGRIAPKCPHVDVCGGCQLQHISHRRQILLKQNNLFKQLKHIGKIALNFTSDNILPPLIDKPWGYRQKARLSVKYSEKTQKLFLGFHEPSDKQIADLLRCDILNPLIGLRFESLRKVLVSLSVYKKIPHIEIACDDDHCALTFRILLNKSDITHSDIYLLKQFGKTYHFQIYLQPNLPEKAYAVFSPSEKLFLSYNIHDITFKFLPSDFTQINPAINAQMVNLALKLLALNKTDQALDLFCGLGNFSLPMAQYSYSVTGIEVNKDLIKRAEENAQDNNIHNLKFYAADLFKSESFSSPLQSAWAGRKYTKILLDPPRAGAKEILPLLKIWKPERIVYVSCDSATLARDAGEIVNKYKYQISNIGLIDMFPQTKHAESIVLFTRDKS